MTEDREYARPDFAVPRDASIGEGYLTVRAFDAEEETYFSRPPQTLEETIQGLLRIIADMNDRLHSLEAKDT